MIRATAIAVLCAFLGVVFWLGATVYSKNIENDISTRTQVEIDKHREDIADISRVVDGRDVTAFGNTESDVARTHALKKTRDVWGVRKVKNEINFINTLGKALDEQLTVTPTSFNLRAGHTFPNLWVSGQVDQPAYELVTNIHQALPPESTVDYSGLQSDGSELLRSSRIVETGIAAVTQLNPGSLSISETQFILKGTVYSEDRKKTIEQLIDVRRVELEPLEIIVNIVVETPGITQACQNSIDQILANNVLNYAVDHHTILTKHLTALKPMANTILGVCEGQIDKVLVEGHADFTGGAGYNQGLSERRSGTVRKYLIDQGIDSEMISAFGYGEFRPIASNKTTEGRAKNRRTEIYLLVNDQMSGDKIPPITLIED